MVGGSRNLREKFSGWIREVSYIFMFADDIHHALQTIYIEFPDVILCDSKALADPGLIMFTGPYERLGIPFPYMVVLADYAEKNHLQRCEDHGAHNLLSWPFHKQDLLSVIEAGISKNICQKQALGISAYNYPNELLSHLPFKLRTPLNTIMGYSCLMSDVNNKFEDNEIVEMSKSVMSAGRILQTFVGKIDMYAQLDRHESDPAKHISKEVLSLVVFDEAFSIAAKHDRASDLLVDINSRSIRIEELYFRACIRELVDNAFRFSAPGTKVLIAGKRSGTSYMLNVFDQGRGYASNSLAIVSDSNNYSSIGHAQKTPGIGLALVERILMKAGGSLDVKIETGKETTVTCLIPLYINENESLTEKQTVAEE